jgi:hypothetical protein
MAYPCIRNDMRSSHVTAGGELCCLQDIQGTDRAPTEVFGTACAYEGRNGILRLSSF